MASTFSQNLAIELIGTGDQAGTWGVTTNTNLGTLIEQAISGYVTQAVSTGADTTITIPNGATGVARNMYIELTGTGGTNTNLIVPSNKKLYIIFNNTASGQVTVKVSGQTGVSVPNGKKMILVSNGTDIVNGLNYIADFGTNSFTVTNLTASSGTITNLIATTGTITTLSATSGSITNLVSSDASATVLRSASATLTHLSATSASITNLALTSLTISSLSITNVSVASATVSSNLTLSSGTANGVLYLNGSKVATSGSALVFDGTNVDFGTVGAKLNFPTTGSSTKNYVGGSADGFSLEMVTQRGAIQPISYKQDYSVGHVWSLTGTGAMALTSTGLGIGTASPNYSLTSYKAGAVANYIQVGSGATGTGSANGLLVGVDSSGNSVINAQGSGSGNLLFATSTAEKMRLDTSGNLGIGTSSPGSKLTVSGDIQILSTNYLSFSNTAQQTYIRASATNTLAFGTSSTQAMTLHASGGLSVGSTTDPGAGAASISGTSTNSQLAVTATGVANTTIGFNASGGTVQGIGNNCAYVSVRQSYPLVFGTAETERARITSGGTFCVGSITGNGRLTVYGTGATGSTYSFEAANSSGNTRFLVADDGTTRFYKSDNNEGARFTSGGELLVGTTANPQSAKLYVLGSSYNATAIRVASNGNVATSYLNDSGTEVGYVQANASSTAYSTSSDRRLKSNIAPADEAGSVIDAIQIVKHDWKVGGHTRYGMIAQDLHVVAPEAVSAGDDGEQIEKTWGVDYSKLVPMLVKEIQSLRARVTALESA